MRMLLLRTTFLSGSLLRPRATVRRAGELFGTPLASSRTRAAAVSDHGAREAWLETAGWGEGDEKRGQRIRTYRWGDPQAQPYVLFAHGWSSHGTRFARWIGPLRAAGYAAVAFDQPAHGRSEGRSANLPVFTDTLLAVARHFGPAHAVVGHSLGGAAAAVALVRGLAAERAVLLAPAADPIDASYRFSRQIGLPGRLCRDMIAMFERQLGTSMAELQAQHIAPRIGRPALIIHDLEDREVPWSEGERYARHWSHARLLTTRRLGHNRIVDDDEVIEAALRFFAGGTVGERIVSSPNLPYGLA
ncbi:alpha/beta hydrolase [Luteimonas suaedae]|uniref:alpha/beta hydrolase n=1 Tax=Luteimonas suaedae TaxID=2605430 RepID=UPI002101E7F6|nr:alpha/beta fold hydrolase [Luteimonas suaedae]